MSELKKLKKIRKEKGFTIRAMSEKLSICPSYYWQLENGRRRLFYDMAVRIASIFNMKPDRIFYSKEK